MRRRLGSLLLAGSLLFPMVADAAGFPDVSVKYPHAPAVERLTELGVIGGFPDGKFRPNDPVNRAAFLKMLYLAAQKKPTPTGGCFPDVEQSSWYELYVCDALQQGYVKGYGDGKFRPGNPVTRAEAIKLTMAVFHIPDPAEGLSVGMYEDVTVNDWFHDSVHAAIALKILPIPGQDGKLFQGSTLMTRGESAAYIWNALHVWETQEKPASSSSASAQSVSSDSSAVSSRIPGAVKVDQHEQEAMERAKANTRMATIPFRERGTFDGKTPFSVRFTVTGNETARFTATDLMGGSAMNCRLYHMGRSGFVQEYYLGFEEKNVCSLLVDLSPGDWQLQLTPRTPKADFQVDGQSGTGDGNDGFVHANVLPVGQLRMGVMDPDDLEDFFKFTVAKNPAAEDGFTEMTLDLISTSPLGCIIYPLDDVDLYGFSGPDCLMKYRYPPGTYVVGVRHGTPMQVRQTYSIQVK